MPPLIRRTQQPHRRQGLRWPSAVPDASDDDTATAAAVGRRACAAVRSALHPALNAAHDAHAHGQHEEGGARRGQDDENPLGGNVRIIAPLATDRDLAAATSAAPTTDAAVDPSPSHRVDNAVYRRRRRRGVRVLR